jgi:hypothetical protein
MLSDSRKLFSPFYFRNYSGEFFRHGRALTVRRNSQTEIYIVESPNAQHTRIYRVSHFDLAGIVLTAFYIMINWSKESLIDAKSFLKVFNDQGTDRT